MVKYTHLVLASIILAKPTGAEEVGLISLDQLTRKCVSMYTAALETEKAAPMQEAALCMETAASIGDMKKAASLYAQALMFAKPSLDQYCLRNQTAVMISDTNLLFRKKAAPAYSVAEAKQDYEARKRQSIEALKQSFISFCEAVDTMERASPRAGQIREFRETKDGIKSVVAIITAELERAQCGFGDKVPKK